MYKEIHNYVVECGIYQGNKSKNVMNPMLLHHLCIPNHKWEENSMDFIEWFPLSEVKDKILVVVDRLTKYAHLMGVKKIYSNKKIAEVFYKNIYKLHGFPKIIVSDKDAKFTSNFWKEF